MVERSSGPEEEEEEGSLPNLGSGKESEVEGTKCKDEESGREKRRKERPELKVIICKDGRSSARVSVLPPQLTKTQSKDLKHKRITRNYKIFSSCAAFLRCRHDRDQAQ